MKRAVVTGAAGAIGAQICRRLTARGYEVIAVDQDEDGLSRLGDAVVPVVADLASYGFVDVVAAEVHGRCDLLVNNAGIAVTTPFEQLGEDEQLRELAVNLVAPMRLTRALYPVLSQARGHVISVVSLGSMLPLAQSPGYAAGKFGLRGFMHSLAMREKETGVRVSIVNPGSVDTPMLRHEAATGGSPLNFLGTPLQPSTVAETVVRNLGRPRLERNIPRRDGWSVKAGMLVPSAVRRARPLLERLARGNLREYRRRYGLEGGGDADIR